MTIKTFDILYSVFGLVSLLLNKIINVIVTIIDDWHSELFHQIEIGKVFIKTKLGNVTKELVNPKN